LACHNLPRRRDAEKSKVRQKRENLMIIETSEKENKRRMEKVGYSRGFQR